MLSTVKGNPTAVVMMVTAAVVTRLETASRREPEAIHD